jgi:hypothetical protein
MSPQVTTTEYLTSSGRVVRYTASSSAGLATLRGPVRLAVLAEERAVEAVLQPESGR